MLWLLLAITTADAKDTNKLTVPGVPLAVNLPEVDEETEAQSWGYSEGDATTEIKLALRNTERFANVTIQSTDYQPILDAIADNLVDEIAESDDEETAVTPGELERLEAENIGEYLSIPLKIHDGFMEQDFWGRTIVFPVLGHGVLLSIVTSKEEPEHLDAVVEEVLGMLEIKKEPLPDDELPTGRVTADAGYELELPSGWRALTEEEARRRSAARIAGDGSYSGSLAELFVVDTAHLSEDVFNCEADANGTLEVIDPERSPRAAENFLTMAEVSLKGGRFRFVDGTEERFVDVMTETPVIPEGEGSLDFIDLGDREAYLWKVSGTLYDDPVEAAVFYTSYDDVSLTCYAIADEDQDSRIGSFEKAMRSLSVIDGINHPMHFSLKARYIRWWPSSNPLLQLYWLPIPIFLLGSWLIFKD